MRDARGVSRKALQAVLALLTALSPLLTCRAFLAFYHKAALADHVPILSDSLDYWHEVASVAAHGLRTGYYGYELTHAPVWGFGTHGPWYPLFMGMLARVFDFGLQGIPVLLQGVFFVCCLCYMALTRPGLSRSLFLLLFTATYIPMTFWSSLSQQETLHLALGVLLAGMFVRLRDLSLAEGPGPGFHAAFLAVATFATLMRLTWVLAFFPYFLAVLPATRKGRLLASVLFGMVFALFQIVGIGLFQAPFPFFDSGLGKALHGDFGVLTGRLWFNVKSLVLELGHDPYGWDFVMRMQVLLFTLALAAYGLYAGRRRNGAGPGGLDGCWSLLPFGMLAVSLAMMIVFYLTNGIFVLKTLVPVFVFAVFFCARDMNLKWLYPLVLINVLSFPSALGTMRLYTEGSFDRTGLVRNAISSFREKVAPFLVYSPSGGPWCNTLVFSDYSPELLGVDPGIGLNYVRSYGDLKGAVKARYILAPVGADLSGLSGKAELTPLVETRAGVLYLNRLGEAACTVAKEQ